MESSSSQATGSRSTSSFSISSACDSCKRRKIRCDGAQPCSRCVASKVVCTFGSGVGRTNAVAYVRHLEQQVTELQALIARQSQVSSVEQGTHVEANDDLIAPADDSVDTMVGSGDGFIHTSGPGASETYHGAFSGLNTLRRVRDLCSTMVDPLEDHQQQSWAGQYLAASFDCASLSIDGGNRSSHFAFLPPKDRTLHLVYDYALDQALSCKELIPRNELSGHIDTLYSKDPELYNRTDRQRLALLYALLALGRRFEIDEQNEREPDQESGTVKLQGLSYFHASTSLIDLTDTNNLTSIRTIVCLSVYLLASSMLSRTYSYICVAIAASQRMGLHISNPALLPNISEDELTERRVVFSVVNIMDTYLSSTIGMPNILRDSDSDQLTALPQSELADGGVSFVQRNPASPVANTILLAEVYRIQARIVEHQYPLRQVSLGRNGTFELDTKFIEAREAELEKWTNKLPDFSSLPTPLQPKQTLSQLLLRISRAGVQMSLYRPFIHHIIKSPQDQAFSYKGFEYASACIRAAQEAVWVTGVMEEHGVLHEAQWFTIYMLSMAGNIMMLFALANPQAPTIEEVDSSIRKALGLLEGLTAKSVTARSDTKQKPQFDHFLERI